MFKNLFAIENTERNFSFIMTTAVLLILAIPVGIANVVLGYIILESPCTQCWFERAGMIAIGIMGIFILRYGPRPKYIAMMVVSTWWGFFSTLRHTAVYLSADLGQGLGDKILGAHTYTWGVFVYWCAVDKNLPILSRTGADFIVRSSTDSLLKSCTSTVEVELLSKRACLLDSILIRRFAVAASSKPKPVDCGCPRSPADC